MTWLASALRPSRVARRRVSVVRREIERAVSGPGARRMAVLAVADDPVLAVVDPATATVLDAGLPAWRRFATLAGVGPLHLLVDAGPAAESATRVAGCLRLLAPGGRYLVAPAGDQAPDALRALGDGLRALAGEAALPGFEGLSPRQRRGLAEAVGEVTVRHGLLVVTRRRTGPRTLAALREREAAVALHADPQRGQILHRLPGVTLEPRCELRENVPGQLRVRRRLTAPPPTLRSYAGVVCATKGVVTQRGLVLPETFRHPRNELLQHMELRDAGQPFVRRPAYAADPPLLNGTYFHLDNEHRGFFGHALTEQLARLWAWPLVRERHPDAQVLVSLNRGRPVADWERTLLAAAGVEPDALRVIDGPVRIERLLGATPLFSMPLFVHPLVTDTWDRTGEALRSGAGERPWPERVFLSRRHDKRACTNRGEVEALVRGYGFEVVFPEDLPLADQAMLVHRADVVAGFAGSQMFSLLLSDRPKHVVLLRSESYRSSNEWLIGAVRGHRLDSVTCRAAIPRRGRGRDRAAFRSDFTYDDRQEGVWLRGILDAL
jgi:capsular polysaccharide biosynthesis protein